MASKIRASKGEAPEDDPPGQGESHQDQPPSEPDLEEIAEIIISEGDESDITIEEPQGSSTPRSGPARSRKRQLEDQSSHLSPPKAGNERRGEEHAPTGSGSAYRGGGGGPPSKKV